MQQGNLPAHRALCERLYESEASELILYGRALGLAHSEAEDVLQDTFVSLLERPVEIAHPRHYLVRSYRNRALNYRRSLWRRLVREWESRRWFEPHPDESGAERAAMRCLERLPMEQREVIVLKIWHRYTYEVIGELLDISPNTAAGRYRYGIEKMRSYLKGKSYAADESPADAVAFLDSSAPFAEP